jgi:hypothetical protein
MQEGREKRARAKAKTAQVEMEDRGVYMEK